MPPHTAHKQATHVTPHIENSSVHMRDNSTYRRHNSTDTGETVDFEYTVNLGTAHQTKHP